MTVTLLDTKNDVVLLIKVPTRIDANEMKT